ncbi:MAG TPA: DNA repair protein RecO [Cyclobacteriaceae bacterium]|nr:DNA repair protein RecO [Cyclobacteriaceae bacterium]
MLFKTTGIVFRLTKYGETSIIVSIFTSEFGLQSYIVNGARSKSGKGRIALYQPLTLLDLVVYHKETGGIMRIKEIKCLHPYQHINTDVNKTTIALFIEELVNKSIKEEAHSEVLCDFLIRALMHLDGMPKPGNFHLIFMVKLSRHLGFQPQTAAEVLGGRVMDYDEESVLTQVINAGYDTEIPITNVQRRNVLDALVRFYSMHVEGFGMMKSVEVLREIFS